MRFGIFDLEWISGIVLLYLRVGIISSHFLLPMGGENDGGRRKNASCEDPGIVPECNQSSQDGPALEIGSR